MMSRPEVADTIVIGVGNLLRSDDGVGERVATALSAQELPPNVEVEGGGTQGLGLVNLMAGRRRAIFVDAVDMGLAPGEFIRFTLDQVRLPDDPVPLSIHAAGLRDALMLARALGVLPREVVVFGVQPASTGWDQSLSPQVEATLPALIARLQAEISVKPTQRSVTER
jgi:hydrogenase maturation protease